MGALIKSYIFTSSDEGLAYTHLVGKYDDGGHDATNGWMFAEVAEARLL